VNQVHIRRYADPAYVGVADRFVAHAHARGVDPHPLAVAWWPRTRRSPRQIIGARNVEQMEASLGALEIAMTPEWAGRDLGLLARAAAETTDRSEEKSGIFYQGTEKIKIPLGLPFSPPPLSLFFLPPGQRGGKKGKRGEGGGAPPKGGGFLGGGPFFV